MLEDWLDDGHRPSVTENLLSLTARHVTYIGVMFWKAKNLFNFLKPESIVFNIGRRFWIIFIDVADRVEIHQLLLRFAVLHSALKTRIAVGRRGTDLVSSCLTARDRHQHIGQVLFFAIIESDRTQTWYISPEESATILRRIKPCVINRRLTTQLPIYEKIIVKYF